MVETVILAGALAAVAGILAVQSARDRALMRRIVEKQHDLPPEVPQNAPKGRVISHYKPKNNDGGDEN